MSDKKNVGIITEQGFVAGSGLGFTPVVEKDLKPYKKKTTADKKEEKESKK